MGRKPKSGLERFPVEVSIFQDRKVRQLVRVDGAEAVSVYMALLCVIYKRGYYVKLDDRLCETIAKRLGLSWELVLLHVIKCADVGLFSKGFFHRDRVLTSRGIQRRYLLACQTYRRTASITDYDLINHAAPRCRKPIIIPEKQEPVPEQPEVSEKSDVPEPVQEAPAPPIEPPTVQPVQLPPIIYSLPLSPPVVKQNIEQEVEELKKSECWLDNLQCLHHMPIEQLRAKLDTFLLECKCNGIGGHANFADAQRHFNSWLRIINNLPTNDSNRQNNKAQRRGNLLTADGAKEKEYGGSF